MSDDQLIPLIKSIWQHENGHYYEVYDITNEHSTRLEEYPVRVSYRRTMDGTRWSKDVKGFLEKRRFIGMKDDIFYIPAN